MSNATHTEYSNIVIAGFKPLVSLVGILTHVKVEQGHYIMMKGSIQRM